MKQRIKEWLQWNIAYIGVAVYFGAIAVMIVKIIWG